MTRPRWRFRALIGTLLWLSLVAVLALPLGAPWAPAKHTDLQPSSMFAPFGEGRSDGARFCLEQPAADGGALAVRTGLDLDAAEQALLGFELDALPRSLEATLVWRTRESPDDVFVVNLPWHSGRPVMVDLRREPKWTGTVVELGVALYPTALVQPPGTGFAPTCLTGFVLESVSIKGVMRATIDNWFDFSAWTQRSVHSLGRDVKTPPTVTLIPLVALLPLCLLVASMGAPRRRLLLVGGGVLVAWIALDLRWQWNLMQQNLATADMYFGKPWSERAVTTGDADVIALLSEAGPALSTLPRETRLFIGTPSSYVSRRIQYHLAPRMAFAESPDSERLASHPLRDGDAILLMDLSTWRFDAAGRVLSLGQRQIRAEPLYQSARLSIYRVRGQE